MNYRSWCALAIGSMVIACTAQPIRPIASKAVVAVPSSANCTFDATHRQSQNCCVMQAYRARVDVDVAYDTVVREYGFRPEPREYELEGEAYPDRFHGHRHETHAGHSYRLKGIVVPRSDARLARGLWLGLDLRGVEPGSVEVAPLYCSVGGWSMENQALWHDVVQRSIRSTLPAKVD
ncbi:MAG TPA: hypothetical protein PKV56_11870 [Burkholderiaceae bacterium]|jgi:hypothetical protein|nr:hypothetical protein [Burkholderiaceae bacterium]